MTVEDLTIREARELSAVFGGASTACPFRVGSAYMIRTVTMTWTGRVREIIGAFLVLDEAAWIADTGRFSEAACAENLSEVEYVGSGVVVALGAVVDARPWLSAMPTDTK